MKGEVRVKNEGLQGENEAVKGEKVKGERVIEGEKGYIPDKKDICFITQRHHRKYKK